MAVTTVVTFPQIIVANLLWRLVAPVRSTLVIVVAARSVTNTGAGTVTSKAPFFPTLVGAITEATKRGGEAPFTVDGVDERVIGSLGQVFVSQTLDPIKG